MNNTVHDGTGRSPAESMFGYPYRMGLSSMYPLEMLDTA